MRSRINLLLVRRLRSLAIVTASATLGVCIGRKSIKFQTKNENGSFNSLSSVTQSRPILIGSVTAKTNFDHDGISRQNTPATVNTQSVQSGKSTGRVIELMKYGFPNKDNLISYEDFVLSYDKRNRNANWVIEHLQPETVKKKSDVNRSGMKFLEDVSVHSFHRATNKDYDQSGYDRGHLAAAANHRNSTSAMSQTFFLTNIAPQVGEGFNRDSWNDLERYVRSVTMKNKNVYICTGPLYLPRREPDGKLYVKYEVIGTNHVAVPTHFFKVLVIENDRGELDLQSFVMPNQKLEKVKLKSFMVPIETIERAAGLNLFPTIPRKSFRKINTIANV